MFIFLPVDKCSSHLESEKSLCDERWLVNRCMATQGAQRDCDSWVFSSKQDIYTPTPTKTGKMAVRHWLVHMTQPIWPWRHSSYGCLQETYTILGLLRVSYGLGMMGPHLCLLNYWILGRGNHFFSCVPTKESTRLWRIILNPWPHNQFWISSVDLNKTTATKVMNVERRTAERSRLEVGKTRRGGYMLCETVKEQTW